MIGLRVEGFASFDKIMRGLDPTKARGVKVKILRAAAEPIRERMEELVTIGEVAPHIVDHIKVSPVRKVNDQDFGGEMALDEDAAAVAIGPSKDYFYGKFLEFGTAPHGNHPGTPANPFASPAFDEKKDAALKIAADEMWKQIRNSAERSTAGRTL